MIHLFNLFNPLATRLILAALLASGTAAAHADDTRYYLGAGVSAGEFSGAQCSVSGINCDQEIGFGLFGGFQFNRHTALEAGYLGTAIWNSNHPTSPVGEQPEISSLYLAGIGRIPFGGTFALTGRLGAHQWSGCDTREVESSGFDGMMQRFSVCPKESGTGILFGFGAEYDFYEHLRGQLNWTRFNDAGNGNLSALSFNLVALF